MDAKDVARQKIEGMRDALIELSHRIHANPELGYEEVQASAWLAESLTDGGFEVETGVCDLPTAFIARAGSGPLHLGICAEYDSLPVIGHACGHNIIAAMALGAGLAAASVADEVGLTVSVIGTPAEEVGDAGGKILMLERGAFEGLHAADALTIAQTSIGLLRQHMLPTQRVHGIVTSGGDAPNVIPAHTSAKYIIRGQDLQEMEELRPKVQKCFEAGALATGSTMEIVGGAKPYPESTEGRPWGQPLKKPAGAPLNLG